MKRQKCSVILLASLLLPIVLMVCMLHAQRTIIRKEVKEFFKAGIADAQLEKLIFHDKETQTLLTWEHEAEFEYCGTI